jgi:uncharacterized protein YndB with AHSA1/START domain
MAGATGGVDTARTSDVSGGATPPPGVIMLSRRIPARGGVVWQALTSPGGTDIWLGHGAVLEGKGQSYHCDDGSGGVVRSFHPLEQLRLSWHELPNEPPSLIELDLTPLADGTLIRLWHENVPSDRTDGIRAQWELRLNALTELFTSTIG